MRRLLGTPVCAGALACGISAQETYEVRGTVEEIIADLARVLAQHREPRHSS